MKIKDIFISHLLLPIVSIVLVTVVTVLNKNNQQVSLKELLIFLFLCCLILALPGLSSWLEPNFVPVFYLYLQLLFLGLGYFYMKRISQYFSSRDEIWNKGMMLLCTLIVLCLGCFLFSLLFNYVGDLPYGLMASTCTFTMVIPLLFSWAYSALLDIPSEIFKVWVFNPHIKDPDFTSETLNRIRVLELELSKKPDEADFIKVKAKAPDSFVFGDWFQLFLHDYNSKYLDNPISNKSEGGNMYQWIFYTKPSFLLGKRYIDHDKSIEENNIEEKHTIMCKRVDNIYRQ
jgi:hypothetical protein